MSCSKYQFDVILPHKLPHKLNGKQENRAGKELDRNSGFDKME